MKRFSRAGGTDKRLYGGPHQCGKQPNAPREKGSQPEHKHKVTITQLKNNISSLVSFSKYSKMVRKSILKFCEFQLGSRVSSLES